jgi:tetratricopeptide (TPR) repeat protein
MSDSASKKLTLVRKLTNGYRIEDALQLVEEIEQMENLTQEESLKTLLWKARLYRYLGQYDIALQITDEVYNKSQDMNTPFYSLYALCLKGTFLYFQQRLGEAFRILEKCENLFNSIPREDSFEFQELEGRYLGLKYPKEHHTGNLDLALDIAEQILAILEKNDPNSIEMSTVMMGKAYTYANRGELDLALECAEKALSLTPKNESYYSKLRIAETYRVIGGIYNQKGDLDLALDYHKRALEIHKEIGNNQWMSSAFSAIISDLIDKKNVIQAQNYLEEFKQWIEHQKVADTNLDYQNARALILRASPRTRDHAEAENILKKIIEDTPEHRIYIIIGALINLIGLYLKEFRLTNQMEILDDIYPLIDHLQRIGKQSHSYTYLALVKLFQAKLTLLQMNMGGARKLLTEAQSIADEHGLHHLAGMISREHDGLLEELKLWESFKKRQASVSERLKLASIDEVLEHMQRRTIEIPEVSVEESILLLIMDKNGVSYFTHSFIGDWDFDDLFSSFMSAFNTFSSEIFSNSIDRVKIAENTILIDQIDPFLACYVIKGQSYPAQQKLARFTEAIRTNSEIWQALKKSVTTSEMLGLNNPPMLRTVIDETFTR